MEIMATTKNINEFTDKVEQLKAGIVLEVKNIHSKLALTAIDLVTSRLVEKGVTGEGKSLGEYSDKPMAPGYFIGTGKGADDKVQTYLKSQKKGNGILGISYKKFRELNNLPTDHVTLSFTGETLADVGVLQQEVSGNVVNTGIGSKNSKTKPVANAKGKITGSVGTGDVLRQLEKRYGDILSINEKEEELIGKVYEAELQTYLDKVFK